MTDTIESAMLAAPEGADIRADVELVHGGWCAYAYVTPDAAPITPADRPGGYGVSGPYLTRAEAIAALPAAIRQAIAKMESAQ